MNDLLLRKYVAGTCTPEELVQVLRYVATPAGQDALKQLLDAEAKQTDHLPALDRSVSERIYRRLQLRVQRQSRWSVRKIAASVSLLLLGVSLWYAWLAQSTSTYVTRYGETQTILLPDSSTVLLNANSRLTLSTDWTDTREVWLEGEAFFRVRKIKRSISSASATPVKFIVRTDRLNVEVLGTEFNVRQRPETTAVLLKSGRVRLNLRNQPDTLNMLPGELVTLRSQSRRLDKETVNPEAYTSWTERRLDFDGTTLREIARIIEETYGHKVVIRDESLANKRFQGSVPADDLDILLEGLSETFDIRITRQNQQILMQP